MKIQIASVFLLLFVVSACGPSQRELAVSKTNQAQAVLKSGDTLTAISILDSIKILYPKAEVQKTVAANIRNELYRQLIDVRWSQSVRLDSVIARMKENFNVEKGEFDRYALYIPKQHRANSSWHRSFIEATVDERGILIMVSNYFGTEQLNHTSVKVYDGDLQASAQNVAPDDPDNYRGDFIDSKWEKVTFRNGKADEVLNFIVSHSDRKLKCVFLGKQNYYIVIEPYDIQAMIDAVALSKTILHKKALDDEIKKLKDGQ